MREITTIEKHIIERQKQYPEATGVFSNLLYDIALATKIIANEVRRAGLEEILGSTGRINVQGEEVQKLDEFAHNTMVKMNLYTGRVAVMASEEEEGIINIPEEYRPGKYVLLFDPLDGSSNIDVNAPLGTIFGIYRKVSEGERGTIEDCLQPGYKMVAAGYVLYGPSTMLVYSAGDGVHGFTLDPTLGEFLLSHPLIRTPLRGKTYSINEGNYMYWDEKFRKYIDYLKSDRNANGKPYKLRYIGTLVADFHRTLLEGGIFMYPGDKKNKHGKLRLVYEAAPLAFIAQQAGGYASNGEKPILDIKPDSLHQRTPLFIGSYEDVKELEAILKGEKNV